MEEKLIFTEEEKKKVEELCNELRPKIADSLQPDDETKLKTTIEGSINSGLITRDAFGFNPFVEALQTAKIAIDDIGLRRDGVIAILLYVPVLSSSVSIDDVKADFGEGVSKIIHGLVRIQELYKKNPKIESENFRNLLLSFAEDMRVILIMIADRVNLMRQIRDTENTEARHEVAEEASYLYAPLAHKLGLYQLKSELEDLSLKYLEHDAYYEIKDDLNATKRSRDAYIERFIKPVKDRLEAAWAEVPHKGTH